MADVSLSSVTVRNDVTAFDAVMSTRARLVVLSCLMLFVELALIRWLGSNVVYLSYFSNFVLLGSFLGIGLGFLRANSKTDLFPWALTALAALVAFVFIFPVRIDRSGSDLIYFGGTLTPDGLPMWFVLPVIFLMVALVLAAIAQGVARTFALFEPLEAYRLDILGSLAGIALFTLLSFMGAPPLVWGVLARDCFSGPLRSKTAPNPSSRPRRNARTART